MLNRRASEPSGGKLSWYVQQECCILWVIAVISFTNVVISFNTSFAKAEIRL